MKKNFFYAILMVLVALLCVSCNKYEKKVNPIKGTNLSYFSAQDPNTGKDLWGIQNAANQILKEAIYLNIVPQGELFVGTQKQGINLFDRKGKDVIDGNFSTCVLDTASIDSTATYFTLTNADGKYLYLIKEKIAFGPYTNFMVGLNQIFYYQDEAWGIIGKDKSEVLPPKFKEIIVITETKTSQIYYLAKDEDGWNIYKADGKLLKKMPTWQLGKYTKGSIKSEISEISYLSRAKI